MLLKYISNTFAVQTDSIKELVSHAQGNDRPILYSALDPDNDTYCYVDLGGTYNWLDEGKDVDFEGCTDLEAIEFFRKHW
jgi:hypothetical protein